ncbi:MAG: beta-propeller domain-containing protein [Planctomycetes bacterium]|nr:beta-propeller domain-containing protein [Planctomycetota bacterium]
MPGYSTYIHFYGEDHLLSIGKDTDLQEEFAWYQGLQLSLFEISDFSDPFLSHKELIGDRGTFSEALYQSHAFTFWGDEHLLAFPVVLFEHLTPPPTPGVLGTYMGSGLYVYKTSPWSGFEALGQIPICEEDQNPYLILSWTRGLFIEDYVFAVQSESVRSAKWSDIDAGFYTLELPE